MTYRNNFDTSSTGTDIEVRAFYDNDAAQREFDQNFEILQYSGYSESAIYSYTYYGNFEPDYSLNVDNVPYAILFDFIEQHVDCSIDNEWTLEEMQDSAVLFLEDELLSYEYDLEEIQKEYGIDIAFNHDIVVLSSIGYSQGDYAIILVDVTGIENCRGSKIDLESDKEYLDSLLWDCPIYASIMVNDEEYNYWDYGLNEYKWERDEFIEVVARTSSASVEQLEELLPEQLEYAY